MATTVGDSADSDSLLASRDPELTARFVNDALPYLNQLHDSAHLMCRNAVDAEDLVQETMLRAYAGFNPLSGEANIGAWLFRTLSATYINGLRRAQRHPSGYLTDHITDRQLTAQDRHSSQGPRSAELDALDAGRLRLHRGRRRLRILLRTTNTTKSSPDAADAAPKKGFVK